jgi:hypothetical protein
MRGESSFSRIIKEHSRAAFLDRTSPHAFAGTSLCQRTCHVREPSHQKHRGARALGRDACFLRAPLCQRTCHVREQRVSQHRHDETRVPSWPPPLRPPLPANGPHRSERGGPKGVPEGSASIPHSLHPLLSRRIGTGVQTAGIFFLCAPRIPAASQPASRTARNLGTLRATTRPFSAATDWLY